MGRLTRASQELADNLERARRSTEGIGLPGAGGGGEIEGLDRVERKLRSIEDRLSRGSARQDFRQRGLL